MRLDSPLMLLTDQVRMLYSAECLLTISLPRVAMRAQSPDLRRLVEAHLEQTRQHASRLEQVAGDMGFSCGGGCSHAMKGLLMEGEEVLGYGGPPELVDQAIIAASQRIEHYEISAYKSLIKLVRSMGAGAPAAAELLGQTLREEQDADKQLERLTGE